MNKVSQTKFIYSDFWSQKYSGDQINTQSGILILETVPWLEMEEDVSG